MEESNGSEQKVVEFSKCPACGSERRFFEELGKEMKELGLVPQDRKFYYDLKSGVMGGEEIVKKIPVGKVVPAFAIATDICVSCGTIYAVVLERAEGKKTLTPSQLITPNRAQRRHGGNGGNNPFLS